MQRSSEVRIHLNWMQEWPRWCHKIKFLTLHPVKGRKLQKPCAALAELGWVVHRRSIYGWGIDVTWETVSLADDLDTLKQGTNLSFRWAAVEVSYCRSRKSATIAKLARRCCGGNWSVFPLLVRRKAGDEGNAYPMFGSSFSMATAMHRPVMFWQTLHLADGISVVWNHSD